MTQWNTILKFCHEKLAKTNNLKNKQANRLIDRQIDRQVDQLINSKM